MVLPAPFGPIRPTISPARNSNETLLTAIQAAEAPRDVDEPQHGGHVAAYRFAAATTASPIRRPQPVRQEQHEHHDEMPSTPA